MIWDKLQNALPGEVPTVRAVLAKQHRRFSAKEIDTIRTRYKKGATFQRISQDYKVSLHTIYNIVRGIGRYA